MENYQALRTIDEKTQNAEIEKEVRKMRPPVFGPLMRALGRFYEWLEAKKRTGARKEADRILPHLPPLAPR